MHDGVAQDIASLGYLVDALAIRATDPEQAARIDVLRERISAVVGEVRRSVLTLRTETSDQSESLGSAIGAVARNLTEVSGVPIHVTLDERATRLRPEVEAELFRISQEAMTNAVRHARPSRVDVHCLVHAPEARITVTDDGRGLQAARSDSHGLQIMRERALLINAALAIDPRPRGRRHRGVRPHPRPGRRVGRGRPGWSSERMSNEPIRVLLVDDHELIRSGLSGVFELEDDMRIVGVAGTVGEALTAYDELAPDVVVSDLQLQDGTGSRHRPRDPQAQQRHRVRRADDARRRRPDLRRDGGRCVRLRRQGRAVLRGRPRGSARRGRPPLVRLHRPGQAMMRRSAAASTRLSDREHEVLLLLADGLGAAAIGEQLYMSESTAKSHIARIYQKLGASATAPRPWSPRCGSGCSRACGRPTAELARDRDPLQRGRVGAEPQLRPGRRRGVGQRAQRQLPLHGDEGLRVLGRLERVDVRPGLDPPADDVLQRARGQRPAGPPAQAPAARPPGRASARRCAGRAHRRRARAGRRRPALPRPPSTEPVTHVVVLGVAELVGDDRQRLVPRQVVHERVVDDDAAGAPKPDT